MAVVAALLAVVWIFTWPWDADERLFLATWLGCVLPAVALGRRGRFSGFVAAVVAGTAIPVTVFWLAHAFRLANGLGTQPEALLTVTLLVTAASGGVAALLATGCVRQYQNLSNWHKSRVAGIMLGAIVLALVGRIIFATISDRSIWKPAFHVPALDDEAATRYWSPFSLSDDGQLLAISQPVLADGKPSSRVQLWNLESAAANPRLELSLPSVHAVCFSPDSSRMAVIHTGSIGIYETSTGILEKTIVAATFSPRRQNSCCFSANGKTLAFCNYDRTVQIVHVQVWETENWRPLTHHRLPGSVRLFGTERGALLLVEEGPKVLDAQTLQPIAAAHIDYDRHGAPFVTRDGRFVACGRGLVEIDTGTRQELAAIIYCLAAGQRFVTRRSDMGTNRSAASLDYQNGIPLFRHWWRRGTSSGQIVLLDVATGEELAASPDYPAEAFVEMKSSADGKTVAGQTWAGTMYVWRVLE